MFKSTRMYAQVFGVGILLFSMNSLQCGRGTQVVAPPDDVARITTVTHSDCTGEAAPGSLAEALADSADVEIRIEGLEITVIHRNAMFNCCLDYIQVLLTQDESLLKLEESESVTMPCLCICPYEVNVTIEVPSPGTYTIEIWAHDMLLWSGDVDVGGQ
jgi:hypothetical protein